MLWTDLERFGRLMDPWRTFESLNRGASRLISESNAAFPAFNVWSDDDRAVVATGSSPNGVKVPRPMESAGPIGPYFLYNCG